MIESTTNLRSLNTIELITTRNHNNTTINQCQNNARSMILATAFSSGYRPINTLIPSEMKV